MIWKTTSCSSSRIRRGFERDEGHHESMKSTVRVLYGSWKTGGYIGCVGQFRETGYVESKKDHLDSLLLNRSISASGHTLVRLAAHNHKSHVLL
jgi:hypothetical protein